MRTLFQRVLVTFMSTTLLAAAGVLGGYLLGRDISMRQAQLRLDQYANRILLEGSASSTESRQVLAAMNASPFPVCSDAEVAYFRQLIFQSQFLESRRTHARRSNRVLDDIGSISPGRVPLHAEYLPARMERESTGIFRRFASMTRTVITLQ